MSATDALHIYQANGTDEAPLREAISEVEGSVIAKIVSGNFKNTNVSGNPEAGSVKVSRFLTPTVKTYGTARTAGKGDYLKDNYVTVNLDQRKEIVEEINRFDAQQYGIYDLLTKRREQYARAMAAHLDKAFFAEAVSAGTEVTPTSQTIADQLEEVIQSVESVSNSNVDGIDRDQIAVAVSPYVWGQLKNHIDTLANPSDGGVKIELFHGVEIYECTRLAGADVIAMAKGAIAEPAAVDEARLTEIPLSADYALGLYFNYGVKALMPDLIKYATLGEVSA